MKCLDTTFLIDFLRGAVPVANVPSSQLCTTQINVYEVLFGICRKRKVKHELAAAEALFSELTILPLSDAAVLKAALIAGSLVQEGREIQQNDCMIAAIALSHGIDTLVTNNREHFARIKGIDVQGY